MQKPSDSEHDKHDAHSLLQHTHNAFGTLVEDAIKSRLANDAEVSKSIEELAEMGYSLIKQHIGLVVDDIKKSVAEIKSNHCKS